MVVVVFPPVFNWLAGSLLNLPNAIRPLVHQALILLLPWPAAIGYRRFKQGLLIRHGLTRHVAYGALVRLTAMAATAGILVLFTSMRGASVGTFALSTGVIAEAIMSGRMARRAVRALESGGAGSKRQLTMRQTVVFYIPLALTAMLAMGTQPMVTFMMGQSRMVVESLAVFPVISGLTFMFRSLGLSFQEVGVALLGPRMKHLRPLCKFGVLLALVSSSCLAVVAYSPVSYTHLTLPTKA